MTERIGREHSDRFSKVGIEATNQAVAIECEGSARDTGDGLTKSPLCAESLEHSAAGLLGTRPTA